MPFLRLLLIASVALMIATAGWFVLGREHFPRKPDVTAINLAENTTGEGIKSRSEIRPILTLPPYTRPTLIPSLREQRPESMNLEQVMHNLSKIPSLPPGEETDARELALVLRWATFDPVKACRYAYEAALDGADEGLLREAVTAWAKIDPAAAVHWSSRLGSPLLRDIAVSAAYGTWASKNQPAAETSLKFSPGSATRYAAWIGMANLSVRNPKNALVWAVRLPGPLREKTLQQVFGSWMRRDPQAAAEWLASQPVEIQLPLAGRLASEWARKDPQSALYWSRASDFGSMTATRLPNGPVQRRAMDAAIGSFVASDPEAAAAWMTSGAGRAFFAQRVSSIVSSWASIDPMAAAGWVSTIAGSRERDAAVASLAATWSRSDPAEALRWIQGIRRLADRNTALSAFSTTLAGSDPEAAAYWSLQITERALREDTLARVIAQWRGINSGAAAQFVQTVPAAVFLRKKP